MNLGIGLLSRPECEQSEKRGFHSLAAACGGGVHPCTRVARSGYPLSTW